MLFVFEKKAIYGLPVHDTKPTSHSRYRADKTNHFFLSRKNNVYFVLHTPAGGNIHKILIHFFSRIFRTNTNRFMLKYLNTTTQHLSFFACPYRVHFVLGEGKTIFGFNSLGRFA